MGAIRKVKTATDSNLWSPESSPTLMTLSGPTKTQVCEKAGDEFLYKISKKGNPVKKKCSWLAKKSEEKVNKICKKRVNYFTEDSGTVLAPPQTVCKETCKSCDPCYENNASKYAFKKNGVSSLTTCRNLSRKSKSTREKYCKQLHFNSAKNVCPVTCEVNFPTCLSKSWKHVRRVPPGNKWHPARDDLDGTDVYSLEFENGIAWSKDFESEAPKYNEFLFSTGDKVKWLVAPKSSVMGWYWNEDRNITRSSINPEEYSAKWFRRPGTLEDPWISLTDHLSAISEGNIIYGEDSHGSAHAENVLPHHDGADVYIRKN